MYPITYIKEHLNKKIIKDREAQNIFSFLQPGENVNLQKRKFKIERKNYYNQLR